MNTIKGFLIIIFVFFVTKAFAAQDKLTKKGYEEAGNEKAIILYGLNWGRQWGCSGFDNAQLQNLTFSRIDSVSGELVGGDIALNNTAKLFSENVFQSHAIIIDPGEYALTGFDIKVSKSSIGVSHIKGEGEGTFKVQAGEIVYIGYFGLDCVGDRPIPWRYYIQKEDFEHYVDQFKIKYDFLTDKQVVYRLFQTNEFGREGKRGRFYLRD